MFQQQHHLTPTFISNEAVVPFFCFSGVPQGLQRKKRRTERHLEIHRICNVFTLTSILTDLFSKICGIMLDLFLKTRREKGAFTVGTFMNEWTTQTGYPVITINTTNGQIQQKRFLYNDVADHKSEYVLFFQPGVLWWIH